MVVTKDLTQLSALLAGHTQPAPRKAPLAKKRVAAANDNRPAAERLAWPALERLAHRGDLRRAFALRHWRDLCYPAKVEAPVPEAHDADAEVRAEIRPSEGELLAAIGWTVIDRERDPPTAKMVNTYERVETPLISTKNRNGGQDARLGGLLFRDGKLIEWGRTKKGAVLRPVERLGAPKGSAAPERSASRIRSYLALKGAVSPFAADSLRRPFSGAPAISCKPDPLPREEPSAKDKSGRYGVAEARALLERFGVDGSVPFGELPTVATRCDDGLVTGPQWVGGIKKPKPLGEISAAAGREGEVTRQVEGMLYSEFLRERLGDHAAVLDLAITDATAKEIGMAMGQGPAYAEKRGPSLIDEAIDALIAIDETARIELDQPQQKVAA